MQKLNMDLAPVIGYLHHAYLLSVAQEHADFEKWFVSNYIQLRYYPETNWLNFYRLEAFETGIELCPLIDLQVVKSEMLKINNINIEDLIINCIKQNCYVWIFIDEFYDPNRIAYKTTHVIHENFIYGVDPEEKCFYSAGFDLWQSYSFSKINFEDLKKAFYSVPYNLPVKMLNPNTKANYKFEIDNTKNLLYDYLNSQNTSLRNTMFKNSSGDCVYGMDIYEYLKKYFEGFLYKKGESDIRILHILWEHKKCMSIRIRYLFENNYLNRSGFSDFMDVFKPIENKALLTRNLQMKYNITHDSNIIKKIIRYIDEIYNEEAVILNRILENIIS